MKSITIDFRYKLLNSDKWLKKHITVEEYFDFSVLEKDERIEVESVPLHSDLLDYFDVDKKAIHQIAISIADIVANSKLSFFKTFWNGQKNSLVERIDMLNNKEVYHEFIIDTELPIVTGNGIESSYEIMRFKKEEESINCSYHVIGFIGSEIKDTEDITIEPNNQNPKNVLFQPKKN